MHESVVSSVLLRENSANKGLRKSKGNEQKKKIDIQRFHFIFYQVVQTVILLSIRQLRTVIVLS